VWHRRGSNRFPQRTFLDASSSIRGLRQRASCPVDSSAAMCMGETTSVSREQSVMFQASAWQTSSSQRCPSPMRRPQTSSLNRF